MITNTYKVLGIMSGTSLDGIDIALLHFRWDGSWQYEIIEAQTLPYSLEWQKKLTGALFYDDSTLLGLNEEYTGYLAEVISDFKRKHQISSLDAVCSHGHTIRHEPENGFTMQIGNLPKLANLTGEVVVCDFRVQDVELGGQGAPLVPIGDELLFGEFDYCLNLGGFANVSIGKGKDKMAFDICPVNTVLNHLAGKLHLPYDPSGRVAASGQTDEGMLSRLNSLGFYSLSPPKSLGIEWVNENILPLLENKQISSALKTFTIHAATQISRIFDQDSASKVLVTGGGAFNDYLMKEIQDRTGNEIVIPSQEVVNYKEALIFGLLGVLRLRGEINVLSSVTGAEIDHSSGRIYTP